MGISSNVVVASPTKSGSPSRRLNFRFSPWVLAYVVGVLIFAGTTGVLSLRQVAVIAFAIQLVTAYQLTRVHERTLSIASVFAALWIIYFPLRLLVITFGEPSPFYFAAVRAASPEQL